MFVLKFKKIDNDAITPCYAKNGDAGMDLFSIQNKKLKPSEIALIRTGISIELPKNTEAQIRSRSGLALNHGVVVLNSPGTIDQGYRGEIGVILINLGKKVFKIEKHMRIAQMVIKPTYQVEMQEVESLEDSNRGEKGFGSTGLGKGK